MKKSTGTRSGISVNKENAYKSYNVRGTVFKKGSSLNPPSKLNQTYNFKK
jgi:hypothetical protein